MAEDQKEEAPTVDIADERYRYIGFEVYGKKPRSFWRSEDERKSFIENVKRQMGSIYRSSVIYSSVLAPSDRIFITLSCLVMIVAPFLTWMKARTLYGTESFSGIAGIFNMDGFWFYVQKMGGWVIPLTIYLTTAMAYISIILGILGLVYLFVKARSEDAYLRRLRSVLKLNLVPFLIFLFIVLLGLIGQRVPFGAYLGIDGLGGRYTIVNFVEFSALGLWLSVFGFILNFNKSKDL